MNLIIILLTEGNNRTYDFIYNSETPINIEVKSTGSNTFQRFRKTALSADYAIWINFRENYNYDIAIFNPQLLNPDSKDEVPIDWNDLVSLDEIIYYKDRHL